MMQFQRTEPDRITLLMSQADYDQLTLLLGYAAGAASAAGATEMFWKMINFVNALNRTNPNFTPYEIPEEFREKVDV
jgi:hypothetical protein